MCNSSGCNSTDHKQLLKVHCRHCLSCISRIYNKLTLHCASLACSALLGTFAVARLLCLANWIDFCRSCEDAFSRSMIWQCIPLGCRVPCLQWLETGHAQTLSHACLLHACHPTCLYGACSLILAMQALYPHDLQYTVHSIKGCLKSGMLCPLHTAALQLLHHLALAELYLSWSYA